MKPKRKTTLPTCTECGGIIEKGVPRFLVYPHPDWQNYPSGIWLSGFRHRECQEGTDNEQVK